MFKTFVLCGTIRVRHDRIGLSKGGNFTFGKNATSYSLILLEDEVVSQQSRFAFFGAPTLVGALFIFEVLMVHSLQPFLTHRAPLKVLKRLAGVPFEKGTPA